MLVIKKSPSLVVVLSLCTLRNIAIIIVNQENLLDFLFLRNKFKDDTRALQMRAKLRIKFKNFSRTSFRKYLS